MRGVNGRSLPLPFGDMPFLVQPMRWLRAVHWLSSLVRGDSLSRREATCQKKLPFQVPTAPVLDGQAANAARSTFADCGLNKSPAALESTSAVRGVLRRNNPHPLLSLYVHSRFSVSGNSLPGSMIPGTWPGASWTRHTARPWTGQGLKYAKRTRACSKVDFPGSDRD